MRIWHEYFSSYFRFTVENEIQTNNADIAKKAKERYEIKKGKSIGITKSVS